jgi:hypothetical protein
MFSYNRSHTRPLRVIIHNHNPRPCITRVVVEASLNKEDKTLPLT